MSKLTIYGVNYATLASIPDEPYTNLGSSVNQLGQVKRTFKGGVDLVIRTASGGGGTLLVENTDYTLTVDVAKTAAAVAAGESYTVYSGITITNVTYQTGTLYFTYKTPGSYTSADWANSTATGWVSLSSILLTYASASTITTEEDLTGDLSVGMKLRITQTTDKYFDITAISATTITVDAGTTYTVANAAITDPAYSIQEMPFGWDTGWWAYTPVLTNLTIGNGTIEASYKRISPGVVSVAIYITFGTTTTLSGNVQITTPTTMKITEGRYLEVSGGLQDTGVGIYTPVVGISGATDIEVRVADASGSYVLRASMSSTIPFTWTTTDIIDLSFTYREA